MFYSRWNNASASHTQFPQPYIWLCQEITSVKHLKETDLHVSNVPVDVHGGCDAVFRDVLVPVWIRLAVHGVNAGDGDSFVTEGYVAVNAVDTTWRRSEISKWRKQWLHFFLDPRRSFPTCGGLFPPLCPCRSCCPAPSCWPAGPPRPLSCGCSSLERFLPRGSSETHSLLGLRKVCRDIFRFNELLPMFIWPNTDRMGEVVKNAYYFCICKDIHSRDTF